MKKLFDRALAVVLALLFVFGGAPAVSLVGLSDFIGIRASAEELSGTCGADGNNIAWKLNTETGLMTLMGSGEMADYSTYEQIPWYDQHSSVKAVVIENNITSIGKYAFYR